MVTLNHFLIKDYVNFADILFLFLKSNESDVPKHANGGSLEIGSQHADPLVKVNSI